MSDLSSVKQKIVFFLQCKKRGKQNNEEQIESTRFSVPPLSRILFQVGRVYFDRSRIPKRESKEKQIEQEDF